MATPIENLMKEHGVLMRIIAIYDKVVSDTALSKELNVGAIHRAASIFRDYIEKHHDRCEERYIFPQFRKANYIVEIVNELHDQHAAAIKITRQILALSSGEDGTGANGWQKLMGLCTEVSRMYRPHMAWEQSVVFPVFYDIVTPDYVRDARKKMESEEKEILGDTGFRGLVGRLSEIEKEVGTYDLHSYTPALR